MAQYIKRKDGYAIRFYAEEKGEQKQIYLYENGWTKSAAELAMLEYKKQAMSGHAVDREITCREYFEKFFEDYVMHNVAATTRRRYAELFRLYAIPALGLKKLSKLKPAHLQSFYTELINSSGLSTTTVQHIHRLLHLAFKYAVLWEYIPYNPATSVKSPRRSDHEIVIMQDDELKLLLEACEGTAVHMPIYIASITGMRLGEVCGLQEQDVDTKSRKFIVRYTYKRVSGEMLLKKTKTNRSKRPVPMLPGTHMELVEYLKKKDEYRTLFSGKYIDSGFFCTWEDGRPLQPDYVTSTFKDYIRKLKFSDKITFHSLRHTHASWLLRQGVHPKIVSERLGHTSVNLTLNIYSHLIPDLQSDVLNKLDASLFIKKNATDNETEKKE